MRKCNFKCNYLDPDTGECEALSTECIGDMCENWKDCDNCQERQRCQEE